MADKKENKKPKSKAKLSDKDQRILNEVKAGRPMDMICAQYMIHRTYVEKLTNEHL